jgi:ribosomal protein L29
MPKTKKSENFKGMKKDELLKQLTHLREEVRVIHFKAEGSRSKNVNEQSSLKKQIARILTEINK